MGKPTIKDLWAEVEWVRTEYSERDTLLDELEDYYFLEGTKEEDEAAEEEGIEVVRMPHGTAAIDMVQDLLADAALTITVPARSQKKGDIRLADQAEKFLQALLGVNEEMAGQALLDRAAWLVAMRGALAARVLVRTEVLEREPESKATDPYTQGDKCPIMLQLRDPRTVYPIFGIDGLRAVVEASDRTVQDIRNTWPGVLKGRKGPEEVEWVEYWDEEYFCYWADGKAVRKAVGNGQRQGPWPHGCGGLPYVFRFGRQTGLREPEYRVRPLLQAVRRVIDRLDMLDSQEATFIAQYNADAVAAFSDEEDFELDLSSGAVNYMKPGERIEWIRAGRQPLEMDKARGKLEAAFQRSTFPHAMYGQDPGRLMAGYALNLLNQGGQIRLKPMIECVTKTMEALLGRALMVAEKAVQPLLDKPVRLYSLGESVQGLGQKRTVREAVELDAKALEGYWNVRVQVGEVLPQDEQHNLVMALRARQAGPDRRPMLSWETVIEKYKLTTSAAEERMRIDMEAVDQDPEVVELRRRVLVEQRKQELLEELKAAGADVGDVVRWLKAKERAAEMVGGMTKDEGSMMEGPGMAPGLPGEMMPAAMQGQPMGPGGMPGGGMGGEMPPGMEELLGMMPGGPGAGPGGMPGPQF